MDDQRELFHTETFTTDGRLTNRTRFDGDDYDPDRDDVRLTGQIERVYNIIKSGQKMSLSAIAKATGDPEASVSAQLRHLRKERFGSHTISREYVGSGLYLYWMEGK